jgi:hypothetical protein
MIKIPWIPDGDTEREARLRELASKLFFTFKRNGPAFTEADVSQPPPWAPHDEVEETLNTWQLPGFHGG